MTAERHARLLRLARLRGDLVAIAILTADRQYRPEPQPDYSMFVAPLWRWRAA